MPKKIMIIDQSKESREQLTQVVNAAGCEAVQVASLKDLVALLASSKHGSFSLLLLETAMPEGSAVEVLPRIKSKFGAHLPKVCFVSGDRDKKAVIQALKAGGCDYVVKPIETFSLTSRLKKLVSDDEETVFAKIEADLNCHIPSLGQKSDSSVFELSEMGFVMSTDLKVPKEGYYEVSIPALAAAIRYGETFSCMVDKVVTKRDHTELHCRFVGLHESVVEKIRSFVMRGVKIEDDKLRAAG